MRAAIVLTLAVCLAAAAFTLRLRNELVDFDVYRTAGARAAVGEPLYRAADGHYQFKYFAPSAFMFVPFAALPQTPAKAIWFALSVAFLVMLVALSLRRLPDRVVPAPLIAIATILTLGKFYAHELELGQANLLFGLVVIAAVAQMQDGRDTGAGITFAAASVVKPYGLVFLPYLLVIRRFGAAAACAAVLVLVFLAPALVYGIGGNIGLLRGWWNTVTTSSITNLTNQDNVSIAAMYVKWLGATDAAYVLTLATSAALLGVCAAAIALRRRVARPEYLEVSLLLVATVLLSPQGWDYVLLLSTPAVMIIVNALPRLNAGLRYVAVTCLALIGLTIYDLIGRAAYARFMQLSIITIVCGVLTGLVVYLRVKRLE